jgi:hypothetical protein
MATGGIFQLITNDGKQDKMLMASDLLKTRLEDIARSRINNPQYNDPTPTLLDIEKTHILFTNAHFKPFAAIGYEYNKVTANSGASTLGSDITFSIPQFGDFFHDMVLYVKLKQPTLTSTAANASEQPLMRWCAYPGERLLEQVEFEVNGNPLDKYTSDAVNFHREFSVQPNKELGWSRCVGQEEPEEGYLDQPNWANSGVASADISHRMSARSFSGDQTPSGQKSVSVYKEMFIPLLFWCNKDVRLSVPSVAIPYGQRFIKMKLAAGNKLVGLVPRGDNAGDWSDSGVEGSLNYDSMLQTIELYINNIFVNPEVHNIFIRRIGFSLIRVHRRQSVASSSSSDEILLQQLKWPIETLFVGMRVKDYGSTDTTLQRQHLDKWHSFAQVSDAARASQGWRAGQVSVVRADLDVFGAVAGSFNNNGTATAHLTLTSDANSTLDTAVAVGDVLTFTSNSVALDLEVVAIVNGAGSAVSVVTFKRFVGDVNATSIWTGTQITALDVSATTQKRVAMAEVGSTVSTYAKTLDTLTIKAHGIPIYNNFPSQFYNSYVPYHYGGPNVRSPKDIGALMVNFCLYPGTYQPSGHINVSRAREFYLGFTSSVIDNSTNGQLVVVAQAINFLLISDGSAVLRYST